MPRQKRADSFEESSPRKPHQRTRKNDQFSMMKLSPKNFRQATMMDSFNNGKNVIAVGSAGSGKTFIACYLALKQLAAGKIDKIIIARSAVNTRNSGFLPGSLAEKEFIYNLPFKNIVNELYGCGTAWDTLTKKGYIEFITTSYIRGLTLENCVVIIDELQNMDSGECESLLTRLGENCQVLLCGDTRQNDLIRKREISCFNWLIHLASRLTEYFEIITFTSEDIVRSELCKAIIMAIEDEL